tara:strand:- start:3654 stop:4739 length:1086 start_codon:yes stop_codon:yes gene_type:complete
MVNWSGVKSGMEMYQKDKLDNEALEIAKSSEARAKELFGLTKKTTLAELAKTIKSIAQGSGNTMPGISGGGSKGSASDLSTEQMMTVLTDVYDMDDKLLTDVYSAGKTKLGSYTNIKKIFDEAKKYTEKMSTGKYVGSEGALGSMISNAVIMNGTENEYDWDAIESQLGFTVDEAMRDSIGTSYSTPGAVYIKPPSLTDKISVSDIGTIKEEAISAGIGAANDEKIILADELSKIVQKKNDKGFLSDADKFIESWIIKRNLIVEDAIKDHGKKSYAGIISLYGQQIEPLKEYFNAESAPFGPDFKGNNKEPIKIDNINMHRELVTRGLIQQRDPVTYINKDGKTILRYFDNAGSLIEEELK